MHIRYRYRSSHCGAAEMNPTSIREDSGSIPGITQWVKDQHCNELWRRLKTWLRSCIAVAVVQDDSCRSDSTPSPGISICHECGPKKQKKKKKKMNTANNKFILFHINLIDYLYIYIMFYICVLIHLGLKKLSFYGCILGVWNFLG